MGRVFADQSLGWSCGISNFNDLITVWELDHDNALLVYNVAESIPFMACSTL